MRVSPGSLSFGASDWRTPKSFRVTADGDADAVDEAAVTLSLAATGSAEYAALPASEVAVAVEDDDVPALRLSASAVAVPEGGSASYTLRLTAAPTADVTVQPAIVSGYGVTLTDRYGNRRFELVFTPSNWSVGQQLTLTAEDDDDAADGAAEVRHWVSIGSPEYPYGLHALLPVTVDDDETPALEVSKRSLRVPLSGGAETFVGDGAKARVFADLDSFASSTVDRWRGDPYRRRLGQACGVRGRGRVGARAALD